MGGQISDLWEKMATHTKILRMVQVRAILLASVSSTQFGVPNSSLIIHCQK